MPTNLHRDIKVTENLLKKKGGVRLLFLSLVFKKENTIKISSTVLQKPHRVSQPDSLILLPELLNLLASNGRLNPTIPTVTELLLCPVEGFLLNLDFWIQTKIF